MFSCPSVKTHHVSFDIPGAFPFLKLPPEIRTMIYRLCIVKTDIHGNPDIRSPRQPAIMRLCRTTRNETLGIFYCENIFTIDVYLRDPASEPLEEEHQRLKFLRALKMFTATPYFASIQEIEVVAILHPSDQDSIGKKMCYDVRILKKRPRVITEEEYDPDDLEMWEAFFKGTQFANTQELRPNDWSNFEDVSYAIEAQLLYWAVDYPRLSGEVVTLRTVRTGRLCEVLTLLMGESQTERHVFA